MTDPGWPLVLGLGMLTALATGLGPLPLLAVGARGPGAVRVAGLAAIILMAAASLLLVADGLGRDAAATVLGVIAGAAVLGAGQRLVAQDPAMAFGQLRGGDARRAFLLVGVMTVHSFAEGIGVGVSFGSGAEFGLLVSILIALHNVPEGLAIGLVLVPRGVSVATAAAWSVFSSLPQPLMSVPAFLSVSVFAALLPAGLGFAAGAMLAMIALEMIPDLRRARAQ